MSEGIDDLTQRLRRLEEENAALKADATAARDDADHHASIHELYSFLFDSLDEGFCIIEFFDGPHGPLSDYIHIEANAAYARHTGIPNVVGQKVREMVPDEADGWVDLYRGVLQTGVPIRFERELVATGRHLELASFRIEPAHQRHVAVIFQDITQRKAAERELRQLNETLEARVSDAIEKWRTAEEGLRQAQKMEALGQLTGGIAHDFNNMLAVIVSSLRIADRKIKRGDFEIQDMLESANQGASRATTLVSRLLAYSRRQPLKPERIDANRLLRDMEVVLRRTIPESIEIEFVRAGGLWSMHADAHALESAILNLAINARDAIGEAGKVTIETANAHLDDAYAAAHSEVRAGQYVQVAVTDTGHGMTEDVIARAFEPFFTTKEVGAGTGLGLSQVYGFVKQSGGHVKIYSEAGVGTTVKLYFPRRDDHKVATSPIPSISTAAPLKGENRLVLVVEDDDDVRRLTVELVRELGFRVLDANGAGAAMALIEQHPEVVLLITDVVMPGINGRKLAERVLALRPSMKVIFTTGYTRNAIVHNGTLDDNVELLMKPYTLEALAAKLARVLR